jgi:hypothetical protein
MTRPSAAGRYWCLQVLARDAEQDEEGVFLFSWQRGQSLGEFELVCRW